jgi:hypothetical protein
VTVDGKITALVSHQTSIPPSGTFYHIHWLNDISPSVLTIPDGYMIFRLLGMSFCVKHSVSTEIDCFMRVEAFSAGGALSDMIYFSIRPDSNVLVCACHQ